MQIYRILLAVDAPELQRLMASVLTPHTVRMAPTFEQACAGVDSSIDLIICGLHFDSGRMYELLKWAKSSPSARDIPFLCVQLTGSILPAGTYKAMASAFSLLGGDLLVQVAKWRIELGDAQAFAKLRDVVQTIVPKHYQRRKLTLGLPLETQADQFHISS